MESLKIFIWQSSVEHHEYYTWLSLHSLMEGQGNVTFVLGQLENDVRKAQGWKAVDLTRINFILIPPKALWRDGRRFIDANPDAIHVFLGFRGTRKGYDYFPLILYSLIRKIKVAVINEPYSISPAGYFDDKQPWLAYVSVWVRPILYRVMALLINLVSKSVKPCILPISLIAKEQFRKAHFDSATLFPFGWFVPDFNGCHTPASKDTALRIIYAGAMHRIKGVDILIGAVQLLRSQGYNVILDLYGWGCERRYANLGATLAYKGVLPFETVQGTIQRYDILIIPSRHDGWGVVVNEALLQGVPVIASSRVGAKQLLIASGAGLIFESENVDDLVEKIRLIIDTPGMLAQMKKWALQAGRQILPERGARYFLDVLKYHFCNIGSPPSAIWSEASRQEPQNE